MILCACGCGQVTNPAKQTDRKMGYVKGEPMRFLQGHAGRLRGVKDGFYRKVGTELEHVLVVERVLGRKLRNAEEVHHVDENTLNNQHNNLVLCQDRAYHMFLHARLRVLKAGGNPNTQKLCKKCRGVFDFDQFHKLKSNASSGRHAFCKQCTAAYARSRREVQCHA